MKVDTDNLRKSTNFDIEAKRLEDELGVTNEYQELFDFFSEHGFERSQYSGYQSIEPMTDGSNGEQTHHMEKTDPGRLNLGSVFCCGALGGNRTCDARFRKPTLYPLSYEGLADGRPPMERQL